METAGGAENRNGLDTPVSERDCEVFAEFYNGFLGKTEEDKVSLLKALTLLRQGQRRPHIHSLISSRQLAEAIFPNLLERELLLTFPSTLESLWSVIKEYIGQYGDGKEAVESMGNWAVEQLAYIKNCREQLNSLTANLRPIPPKEKFELSITLAKTGRLKQRAIAFYKMLLVVLADHPFLCVMPEDAPSTMALGKFRSYVDRALTGAAEAIPVEFFTAGGGHMKKEEEVEIGGNNPIFDLLFEDLTKPASSKLNSQYKNAKFFLLCEVLSEEFTTEVFSWSGQS